MLVTLSKAEMLACWRRAFGYETTNLGVDIEAFEGVEYTQSLIDNMRRWYLGLLDNASPALLPVETMTLKAEPFDTGVLCRTTLPPAVRRVLKVESAEWQRTPELLTRAAAEQRLSRLASPYARPSAGEPLAIVGEGVVEVAPCSGGQVYVTAVCDPGASTYVLDESLLPAMQPGQT